MAGVIGHLVWGGDLGMHAATIERLRASLTHPGNPMVDEDTPSPYYSPWTVLLALLARATGLGTFAVLRVGAAVSTVLLLTGVWRFTRALTPARWAPPLVLAASLLLWGYRLFSWSGFLPLESWILCAAYPSTAAWGMTLHLWAGMPDSARRGWPLRRALPAGLGLAVILLVHQFTGVITVVGAAAFLLAGSRTTRSRGWLALCGGAALGAAVLLVWPYYSLFDLLSGASGESATHAALYRHMISHYGLALLGVPALWARFRRDRRDALVWLFAVCAAVFAVGGLTGHAEFGRILPGAMFAAQAALGVAVAERWPGAPRVLRLVVSPLALLALLCGAVVQGGTAVSDAVRGNASLALSHGLPGTSVVDGYGWITPYVRPGQVVMTDDYFAERRVPAYGAYLVYCPYPDPYQKDFAARARDKAAFFRPGASPAARTALLRRYHVDWVIAQAGDAPLGRDWTPVARGTAGAVLYRVPPGA